MPDQAPIRLGMIGLDTSHAVEFSRIINRDTASVCRVVAGFPGGSGIPESSDRLHEFTTAVRNTGVEIVDSIADVLQRVDVVLVESVDGSVHLEQLRPVFDAGLRVFIDKPVASSLDEIHSISRLAERSGVPCWSSSALRFCEPISALGGDDKPEVVGCSVRGPIRYLQRVPDLYFYGIHGIETLFTIMGTGCRSVSRTKTETTDLVVGVWSDGRIGTYRGLRQDAAFGATVFWADGSCESVELSRDYTEPYQALCREIVQFAKTGIVPVRFDTTIEIYSFMEAADRSLQTGGSAVDLAGIR